MSEGRPIVDLTDDEARRALVLKWGTVDPDVLPAWVAEMDYALDPVVAAAVTDLVTAGGAGYPTDDGSVGAAYTGFAARHLGWQLPADSSVVVGDVIGGIRLALDVWAEPGPVVVHAPAYPPFFDVIPLTGRERVDLPLDPDADAAAMDLDELDQAFAAGARVLLLCNPHNPWGRVFTRAELEGVRDVVTAHGGQVIADEIHGPLTLPGATFTAYQSLAGTAEHAVTVTSPSKAFNVAGLHCAHLVSTSERTLARLREVPLVRNHAYSPLGIAAAVTAYTHGDPWLASLVERLDQQRSLLRELLDERLPKARMRPLEATFLAWVDLRGYGYDDPAAVALERGRVMLGSGHDYHPGLAGHARINIATSPDRLIAIVTRLAAALTGR
ncbi:MalY/PatB family protein [Nocardioides speluncae]|uniref:MalY/PatB family protein n=1 Tax=Nocardioides speluncae TaxID=2670337 RepID=UPI0012B16FC2|nr:aminotransferase class I/II-fold pyridoxal phosphate-dependent enzyme [Nocardioides speluncae]